MQTSSHHSRRLLSRLLSAAGFVAVATVLAIPASQAAHASVADITISSTTHDFGEINVGNNSGTFTVTVTNSGTTTIGPLQAFGTFGPSAPFSYSGGCDVVTMAPGDSCSYTFGFSPTQEGQAVHTGTLTFTDNGAIPPSQGQTFTINLSGTGVIPLEASPLSHNFGDVAVGQMSEVMSTTITNNSDEPYGPLEFNSGDLQEPFGLEGACANTTLAAGASCTYSYRFTPGAAGGASATHVIGVNRSGFPSTQQNWDVDLTGNSPDQTVPTTDPGTTTPGSSVPGSSVPGSSVPGSSVPGSSVPGSSVPGSSVPTATTTPVTWPGAPAALPSTL